MKMYNGVDEDGQQEEILNPIEEPTNENDEHNYGYDSPDYAMDNQNIDQNVATESEHTNPTNMSKYLDSDIKNILSQSNDFKTATKNLKKEGIKPYQNGNSLSFYDKNGNYITDIEENELNELMQNNQQNVQQYQGNALTYALDKSFGLGAGLVKSIFDTPSKITESIKNMDAKQKEEWLKKREAKAQKAGDKLVKKIIDTNSLIDEVQGSEVYDRYANLIKNAKNDHEKDQIRRDFKHELKEETDDKAIKKTKKNVQKIFDNIDEIEGDVWKSLEMDYGQFGDSGVPEKTQEFLEDLKRKDPDDLIVDTDSKNKLSEKLNKIVEKVQRFIDNVLNKFGMGNGMSPR